MRLHGVYERDAASDALNCASMEVLGGAAANLDTVLPREHMAVPVPANAKGKPFLLHVPEGAEGEILWEQAPGTRVTVQRDMTTLTWTRKGSNKEQRRLSITGTLTQWTTLDELRSGTAPHGFKLMLWDDKCAALCLTSELSVWKRLMAVHAIPFTAAVYTDTTGNVRYQSLGHTTLGVLSIRWELCNYLQQPGKSVALTQAEATALLPLTLTAAAPAAASALAVTEDGLVNATMQKALPTHAKPGMVWHFYALCSNSATIRSVAQLRKALSDKSEVAVIWAVSQAAAAAPVDDDGHDDDEEQIPQMMLDDDEDDVQLLQESPLKKAKSKTPSNNNNKKKSSKK